VGKQAQLSACFVAGSTRSTFNGLTPAPGFATVGVDEMSYARIPTRSATDEISGTFT